MADRHHLFTFAASVVLFLPGPERRPAGLRWTARKPRRHHHPACRVSGVRHNVVMAQSGETWRQRNRRKNEEFRQDMAAMNLDSIRKLSELPDDELIAADPRVPGTTHEMEMQRRLKVAIQALTAVAAGSG